MQTSSHYLLWRIVSSVFISSELKTRENRKQRAITPAHKAIIIYKKAPFAEN